MYSDLFTRAGTDIVSKAARDRVGHYLQALKQHFSGKIKKINVIIKDKYSYFHQGDRYGNILKSENLYSSCSLVKSHNHNNCY